MQLYPTLREARTATVLRDMLVVLALGLFVYAGVKVHDTVDRLAVLGTGVSDAGGAVRTGFKDAGDAVGDVPVVGGPLRDGLESAGSSTGGPIEDAGRKGEESAHDLANLLGVVTALIPSALLLGQVLPPRVRQVRSLTAAARVLADPADPGRREAIAQRAAFDLPYGTLVRYTRDPLGDLRAGRFDALVAAALEDAGLRAA
ncbi:MAG TPA: hypothetical protein VF066_17765 [Thermoleophilaceae bacterium]